jgi:hypothetical protein
LIIWRRDYDPSTTLCLRMRAKFEDVTPDIAFAVLADIRVRKLWDHRLEEYRILEETDDYMVQYNKLMKVKIPLFSQRDQLVKMHLKRDFPEPGKHFAISKSCTHPDYPEGFDSCCRTHATMIGYEFGPDEMTGDGCVIRYIYINDLKGSLPGMLV